MFDRVVATFIMAPVALTSTTTLSVRVPWLKAVAAGPFLRGQRIEMTYLSHGNTLLQHENL
jgi:hypothetical protein